MGARRRGNHTRGHVAPKPRTILQSVKALGGAVKPIRTRQKIRKDRIPQGGRLKWVGVSPKQALINLAPDGSEPERKVYGWLVRRNVPFRYQQPVMGGRLPGGAVIDFILTLRQPQIALRVMGYWHRMPGQMVKDDIQRTSLEEFGFIVEDVWEYEIITLDRLNTRMRKLVYGMKV